MEHQRYPNELSSCEIRLEIVTQDDAMSGIDDWLNRARRMVGYHAEASDFLNRAASALPVADTDVELVCRLWTAADEHDVPICDALQSFDEALFDVPGQLEITRGAEPTSPRGDSSDLAYMCTWSLVRPEGHGISVVLAADQSSGQLKFEVRDANGEIRSIGFPLDSPSDLYETLTYSFFTLYGLSMNE